MKKYCILLFILVKLSFSQEVKVVQDLGVWAGVAFEKNILKDFDLVIETQVRNFHNAKKLDDILIDAKLKYSINKYFQLGGNVRYVYDVKPYNSTEHNLRHSLDISYRKKINKKFSFRYRLKHQKEFTNFYYRLLFFGGEQKEFTTSIRNRLRLLYKHNSSNRFYGSIEIFKLFESFRNPYFNKIRFLIGDEINTKIGEFDIAIAMETEINTTHAYSFLFLKTIYKIKK